MLGLVEYEAQVCECGFHESVADEDPDLELDIRVCPICSGVAQNMRILAEADRKALGKEPKPEEKWPDDGRHVRLRRKTPEAFRRLLGMASEVAVGGHPDRGDDH